MSFLPNLVTFASLFCGLLSIMWSATGLYEQAAVVLLLSFLFDGLDGRLARLTNSQSEIGGQLDSLADLVAFGAAPAMLLYFWKLSDLGWIGALAAFLYTAGGAYRLARFNVQSIGVCSRHFTGLPIPGAALALVTLVLVGHDATGVMADQMLTAAGLGLLPVLGVLMVSRVPFLSLKDTSSLRSHPVAVAFAVLALLTLLTLNLRVSGFILAMAYVLSGPVGGLFTIRNARAARPGATQAEEDDEDEALADLTTLTEELHAEEEMEEVTQLP
ncbi:MAG: CDP-diacylglycerol--serine O-phosphatidyltransferase [Desulfovibrionaceae bacterium]